MAGLRAVVTGSGFGIGRAVVEALVEEGVAVLAVDRDEQALRAGAATATLHQDMAEPGCGEAVVAAAVRELGGLDIVVNNVGVAHQRSGFTHVTDANWQATWEVNVMSVVRTCRAAVAELSSGDHSAIVNVASTSGRFPEPMLVDYAASKAAVLSLTGSLATELGPLGIRVNAVSPGPTRTPMWDAPGGFIDGLVARHGLPREEAVAHHISQVRQLALGRPGDATDVADAVTYLASPRARQVSGAALGVHGAMVTHLM